MDQDTYKSVASETQGEFKDKGSKFIAYLFPIQSIEDFEKRLKELKKEHLKSRHHCYGYRLGISGEPYRINDDGEPSGTAGKPIFGQLLKYELSDVAAVVVRYFGGTKLGTSGLIKAYKESTMIAIENATIISKTITGSLVIHFEYEHMGVILNCLKQLNIEISNKYFDASPRVEITLPISTLDKVSKQIKAKLLNRAFEDIDEDTEVGVCRIEFVN